MFLLKSVNRWSPRNIFLADAIGASVSTLILAVGLVQFKARLGLTESTLYFMASVAFCFFIYSSAVFLIKPKRWTPFLKIIATANFGYCVAIWVVLPNTDASNWAYFFFTGDTLLISAIALTEWRYAVKYHHRPYE